MNSHSRGTIWALQFFFTCHIFFRKSKTLHKLRNFLIQACFGGISWFFWNFFKKKTSSKIQFYLLREQSHLLSSPFHLTFFYKIWKNVRNLTKMWVCRATFYFNFFHLFNQKFWLKSVFVAYISEIYLTLVTLKLFEYW